MWRQNIYLNDMGIRFLSFRFHSTAKDVSVKDCKLLIVTAVFFTVFYKRTQALVKFEKIPKHKIGIFVNIFLSYKIVVSRPSYFCRAYVLYKTRKENGCGSGDGRAPLPTRKRSAGNPARLHFPRWRVKVVLASLASTLTRAREMRVPL